MVANQSLLEREMRNVKCTANERGEIAAVTLIRNTEKNSRSAEASRVENPRDILRRSQKCSIYARACAARAYENCSQKYEIKRCALEVGGNESGRHGTVQKKKEREQHNLSDCDRDVL